MLIGVFSDVHGNLEALNACLARFKKEGVKHYICCGDIIGYGPDPEECVRKVSALPNLKCVVGNHDAVFVEPEIESLFNYDAKVALERSKTLLTEKSIRFLVGLPPILNGTNFTAVHGTLADPIKEYFTSCSQFRSNADLWQGQICFVGHTHLPFYLKGTEKRCAIFLNRKEDATVRFQDKARYVVNPGAVGKPRDKNPQSSFGIWDTNKNTFRFIRETYDLRPTLKKMKERKFPSFLIDSLALGL